MKFSIITCTLNSEKFLRDNIESVKNQTFKDYEHIFIDGFSIDKTKDLILEYQKNQSEGKVKFYQLPPKGIANAFNEGIRKSKGEYLIHLNSDDYFYSNDVLERVNNFLIKNDYDWIYGIIKIISEKKGYIGFWPFKKIWHRKSNFLGRYLLKFHNFVSHQAVFIKKKVFEKFGYFNEDLKVAVDTEYWLRIKNKTNWRFFKIIVSNYRIREGANSIKNKEIYKNEYNFIRKKYLNSLEELLARFIDFISQFYAKH